MSLISKQHDVSLYPACLGKSSTVAVTSERSWGKVAYAFLSLLTPAFFSRLDPHWPSHTQSLPIAWGHLAQPQFILLLSPQHIRCPVVPEWLEIHVAGGGGESKNQTHPQLYSWTHSSCRLSLLPGVSSHCLIPSFSLGLFPWPPLISWHLRLLFRLQIP